MCVFCQAGLLLFPSWHFFFAAVGHYRMRNARREKGGCVGFSVVLGRGCGGNGPLTVPDASRTPHTHTVYVCVCLSLSLCQEPALSPSTQNSVGSWHSSRLGSAQTHAPPVCSRPISPMFFLFFSFLLLFLSLSSSFSFTLPSFVSLQSICLLLW